MAWHVQTKTAVVILILTMNHYYRHYCGCVLGCSADSQEGGRGGGVCFAAVSVVVLWARVGGKTVYPRSKMYLYTVLSPPPLHRSLYVTYPLKISVL